MVVDFAVKAGGGQLRSASQAAPTRCQNYGGAAHVRVAQIESPYSSALATKCAELDILIKLWLLLPYNLAIIATLVQFW